MKRRLTFCLAAALIAVGALATHARAQLAEPTPTPDPMIYTDPAMTFHAPPGAVAMGQHQLTNDNLSGDLQTVAVWGVRAGTENAHTIQLQMEAFNGSPDQWESAFESQTHSAGNGILIKGKTAMSLLNGMPAYFVEIASGSGFNSIKQFAILWADGQRGVALIVTGRLGEVSAEDAKADLHDVSAVRYPVNQP